MVRVTVQVESRDCLALELAHLVARLSARLENVDAETDFGVADVGSVHINRAEVLSNRLRTQLTWHARSEPVVHRERIVVVDSINGAHLASLSAQSLRLVEPVDRESDFLLGSAVLEQVRQLDPLADLV